MSASRARRTLAASVIAIVVSVVPAFLVGSVAVLIRGDMGFSESQLGLCIAAFYGASAIFSVPGGRLAEGLGGLRATTVGVVGSTAALTGIAALAQQWWHVAGFLALGGLANALTQPATNLALARAVPVAHQGVAFGVKQTDGSLATLAAGMAASVIAVPLGWRWAVVAAAAGSAAFFLVRPGDWRSDPAPRPTPDGGPDAAVRSLLLLSVGGVFAAAGGASLAGFYVDSAAAGGLSVAEAGWWLVAGSACGTVARVGWGWLIDHQSANASRLVSMLLACGGVGFVLLGEGGGPLALAAGTFLAFAAGWAWPGVLQYGIVRASPGAPARATGIVLAGTSCGGVIGPPVFGWLAEHIGYAVAWRTAGSALGVSAICMLAGDAIQRRASAAARAASSPRSGRA